MDEYFTTEEWESIESHLYMAGDEDVAHWRKLIAIHRERLATCNEDDDRRAARFHQIALWSKVIQLHQTGVRNG